MARGAVGPPLAPGQSGQEVRSRSEGRRDRHAVVGQRVKGLPRKGGWRSYGGSQSLECLNKPEQGGGGSGGLLCRGGRKHPSRPIVVVVKSALIASSAISSQQMKCVEIDVWSSLPIVLGLPPKKSRSTKTGLFGWLDATSKVSTMRNAWRRQHLFAYI
jgi:hypothetical protein